MRYRLALLPVLFVLAACGVTRGEDSASDGSSTTIEETAGTSVQSSTSTPTTAGSPATTAAAGDVAVTIEFGDGSSAELLHGALNDIVGPTQDNIEFVTLVYRGVVPPGFDATVLSQSVLSNVMANELSKLDATTTADDFDEAKTVLFDQLAGLLVGSADTDADLDRLYSEVPYLPFIVELQARRIALRDRLVETASDDLVDPCVRHILVSTEAEGDELQVELAAGADFAALAAERSTGPSGPTGGDLGCAPAATYVAEFAAAVEEAEVGEFVGPIETEFGWHVIVVERYEARQVDGDQLAGDRLIAGLAAATITVDDRVGQWDTEQLTIIAVGS